MDKTVKNFITNHPERVKEAAAYSIAITLELHISSFNSNDIEVKEMRKKVSALGNTVFVVYDKGSSTAISDSCVTFESITPYGTIQIMYDFASRARTLSDDTENKSDYYFVKVTDRIYYRREKVPVM